jgi:hypothetical protein
MRFITLFTVIAMLTASELVVATPSKTSSTMTTSSAHPGTPHPTPSHPPPHPPPRCYKCPPKDRKGNQLKSYEKKGKVLKCRYKYRYKYFSE